MDARHGQQRDRHAGGRRPYDTAASADLSRLSHSRTTAVSPRTSGSTASRTGGESNSMRSLSRFCWRGGCTRETPCSDFDPYPMVLRAAAYLVGQGPLTPQERWEEDSGYSPSTLASNIAALVCAALLCARTRRRGDSQVPRAVRRLPRMSRRELDRHNGGDAAPGSRAALHPHPPGDPAIIQRRRGSEPRHSHSQPAARRARGVPRQRDRRCGFPGTRPLRHPQARRSADRGFAQGGRRAC